MQTSYCMCPIRVFTCFPWDILLLLDLSKGIFLIHNLKSWGVFLIFFLVLGDVDDASRSANSRGSVCYKVFGLSYFFQLVIPSCWFRVFGVHWGVIWCVLSPWSCISFSTPCIFSEYGSLFMLMFCKLVNLKMWVSWTWLLEVYACLYVHVHSWQLSCKS